MTEKIEGFSANELMFSEALASWATRFLHPSGFQCQITIETSNGLEALQKGEIAIAHLIEANCVPVLSGLQNGNSNIKESSQESIEDKSQKEQSETRICEIH